MLDAIAASARPRPAADRRLSGPPRARLPGRLHPVAGAVAQAAGQPLGRPRAVGGAAPDLRARGRDRGLPGPRILDGRGAVRHRQGRPLHRPPDPSRRQASSTSSTSTPQERAEQAKRDDRAPRLRRRRRSSASRSGATRRRPSPPRPCSRKPRASSASAPPPTMRIAQRLYEGVDIGGETVGLITYMRTDGVQLAPRGDRRRSADLIETELRRRLPAGSAARLHQPRPRTPRRRTRRSARPTCSARRRTSRAYLDKRPASASTS